MGRDSSQYPRLLQAVPCLVLDTRRDEGSTARASGSREAALAEVLQVLLEQQDQSQVCCRAGLT